ncbi:hypothetical protein DFA_05204 [Cavenderia fasciculata]|uniref:Uncharacterized protein n=1 Tax=Cavenderia fasciculata TaxID=261658 RepID=F4PNM1_CACFS|nr:uncharacterized protein DFA_05204 [Cavenderia fasciculata]EGG23074.1 hypothetical protein DFA_05204 [Cavenderia fasciculata]|eukprot:XP_004360925.1 hypothetical protein DFA_05204 [Cavenderia fasciculata]
MFPANFYDSEIQEYVHLKQSDDSYLDTISGGSLFNITSNTTFRESVKSLIFDITLGNYSLFKKSIQFELKSSFQNQNQSYLSFINETQNEWKIVGSQDNDDDMNNGTATIPLPASNVVRCGKHSNHTCGNTSHFTNFGVLLYIGSDKGSSGGNNNGGSNANGEEISEEGKWIKKVLVPVCIAVGGAALVSVIVGFFVAKIIRHGRLKYWWASRGASSEHINQDAELSEISNK